MTFAVPMLPHPHSRITSRLPHLPRYHYHPCRRGILAPTYIAAPVGGASLPRHIPYTRRRGILAPILARQERHSCRGAPCAFGA